MGCIPDPDKVVFVCHDAGGFQRVPYCPGDPVCEELFPVLDLLGAIPDPCERVRAMAGFKPVFERWLKKGISVSLDTCKVNLSPTRPLEDAIRAVELSYQQVCAAAIEVIERYEAHLVDPDVRGFGYVTSRLEIITCEGTIDQGLEDPGLVWEEDILKVALPSALWCFCCGELVPGETGDEGDWTTECCLLVSEKLDDILNRTQRILSYELL
jgi:hypothetical protein